MNADPVGNVNTAGGLAEYNTGSELRPIHAGFRRPRRVRCARRGILAQRREDAEKEMEEDLATEPTEPTEGEKRDCAEND